MKFYWPIDNGKQQLQQLAKKAPLQPFCEEVLQFAQSLSKQFLALRQYPEIVALGFWLRKAHIRQMQQEFETTNAEKIVKPRGTVFHLAPSNVDTIFIYSWMLSLLVGNRNIIRISSKEQLQKNTLLNIILKELRNYNEIAQRTVVVTYEHDEKVTEQLSAHCHTRVVWGGDATVQAIRQVPLAPMANELVFPDRFSMSVLNAEKVASLEEQALNKLAEQFYNDSFWFDQMACSSPRLVVWVGQLADEAKECFWHSLNKIIEQKQYTLAPATQVNKFATSLWLAADEKTTNIYTTKNYARVDFEAFSKEVREQHCGAGLFYELSTATLVDVATIAVDKDQTLSYYGFEKKQLVELVENISTRGIDRIVPIGNALDFQEVWDGQNFLQSFVREVVLL